MPWRTAGFLILDLRRQATASFLLTLISLLFVLAAYDHDSYREIDVYHHLHYPKFELRRPSEGFTTVQSYSESNLSIVPAHNNGFGTLDEQPSGELARRLGGLEATTAQQELCLQQEKAVAEKVE